MKGKNEGRPGYSSVLSWYVAVQDQNQITAFRVLAQTCFEMSDGTVQVFMNQCLALQQTQWWIEIMIFNFYTRLPHFIQQSYFLSSALLILLALFNVCVRVMVVWWYRWRGEVETSLGGGGPLTRTMLISGCTSWTPLISRWVHTTAYHSIPQYITVYHTIPQYIIVYHSISQFTTLYHSIS